MLAGYGAGAFALIIATFWVARSISAYVALSAALLVAFSAATGARDDRVHQTEWTVAVVGLVLCVFGLLIARVMMNRSVSLQLLAHIDNGGPESVVEDLRGRLRDMVAFGLIRSMPEGTWGLTLFGRFASCLVILAYSLFRIDQSG